MFNKALRWSVLLVLCLMLAACAKGGETSQFAQYIQDQEQVATALSGKTATASDPLLVAAAGDVVYVQRGNVLAAIRRGKKDAWYGLDLVGLGLNYKTLKVMSSEDGSVVAVSAIGSAEQVYIWLPEEGEIYSVGRAAKNSIDWAFSPSGRYFLLVGPQLLRFDCREGTKTVMETPEETIEQAWVNDSGDVLFKGGESRLIINDGDESVFSLGDDVLGINSRGEALAFRDGIVTAHRSGGVRQIGTVGNDYLLSNANLTWAAFTGGTGTRVMLLKNGKYWDFPPTADGGMIQLSPNGTRALIILPEEGQSVWAAKGGIYESLPWTITAGAQLLLAEENLLVWLEPAQDGRWLLKQGRVGDEKATLLYAFS